MERLPGRASAIYDAPIGGDSYEFNVPLPPRPSPSSKLVTSIMDIRYGGMQGVTPIITGPFNGPGYESLSMRREHVHVKIDLTSIPPSAKNYFGAHIAAGWANPAQSNVYHDLRVSINQITKNAPLSARLGDRALEHLWVDINGRYLKLLDSSTGFKKSTDSDTKQWLTSKPSITMIVAETGLGSTLNIKTTGYLTSPLDDCFGKFNTQDFDKSSDLGRATLRICSSIKVVETEARQTGTWNCPEIPIQLVTPST